MSDGNVGGEKKKRNWILIVLLVLLGIGVLCCGTGIVAWKVGAGAVEQVMSSELRANPVLLEHVGTVSTMDVRWMESVELGRQNGLVFRVEGSKGSGRVVAVMSQQQDGNTIRFDEAKLTLDGDPTEIDLLAEEEQPPVELPEPESGQEGESR